MNLHVSKSLSLALLLSAVPVPAQEKPSYTPAEQAIVEQIKTLRDTPDSARGAKTITLALAIRTLETGPNKLHLADSLEHLSTEGDFGRQTLQTVADTLTQALIETPPPGKEGAPAEAYTDLAKLVRYEHVTTTLETPAYNHALTELTAIEESIQKADFTLKDLEGHEWTLSALHGKPVLVNFWATWCPPCRKEMPDLDALSKRFAAQGLVVLSISDEDAAKVAPWVKEHNIGYPVLLDPGRKTNEAFHIEGIPQSFVFNREGRLVAQSIDMRTMNQFLEMLAAADVK